MNCFSPPLPLLSLFFPARRFLVGKEEGEGEEAKKKNARATSALGTPTCRSLFPNPRETFGWPLRIAPGEESGGSRPRRCGDSERIFSSASRPSCELGFFFWRERDLGSSSTTLSHLPPLSHLSPQPKTGVALLAVLRVRAHAADPVRARRVWRDGAGQRRSCWRRRSWSWRSSSDDGDGDDGNSSRQCCRRRRSLAHGRRL